MIDDPFSLNDEAAVAPASSPASQRTAEAPPWLQGLNPEQMQAVTTTEGPLLVLSGAGTGKTRVLTARLAHILGTGLAASWRVLAVTFTNRAAKEMRERTASLIGPMAEQVWLGTFHALCLRILRRHPDLVGLSSGFSVLDADDQGRVLKALMEERTLDTKKHPVAMVLGVIQRWKDRAWTPDAVPAEECKDLAAGQGLALYRDYQARLLALNACDFGDLLLHVVTLFQKNPDVLAQYQEQFRYILVDEYQDTNVAQYLWLRLLARKHGNLCCVGDDDQSIYSWRGAEVGNILRFEHDFPGAQVVRLERNYRSTPTILGAASGLIRNNTGRLGKELRAASASEPGEKIAVQGVWDGQAEARWVVDKIERLHRDGDKLASMAILVRTGFQTREFEERLIVTGTPYQVIGGPRFYERLEIRDALAYLRLVTQPADDLAFERVVNTPKRGLGEAAVQTLHRAARAMNTPLLAAARAVLDTDELKPRARSALRGFVEKIDEWASLREAMSPADLCTEILDGSGYKAMWRADKSPEAPGRVENLDELVNTLGSYESLGEFLEHVALVMENDAKAGQADAVMVMTLHAAKGLEFDTVFLPGWEEELFPNRRALDEGGMRSLEEERRLAYVGLTRARKRAAVLYASQRRVYNEWRMCAPSRFIEELPEAHIERESDVGLLAGSGGMSESYSTWDGSWNRGGEGSGSTGWGERKRRFHQDREGLGWQVEKSAAAARSGGYASGERVHHEKFGMGTVLTVEGDKLGVAFDKAGVKKVVASFVRRA